MHAVYEPPLWITQETSPANPDFHHGLLDHSVLLILRDGAGQCPRPLRRDRISSLFLYANGFQTSEVPWVPDLLFDSALGRIGQRPIQRPRMSYACVVPRRVRIGVRIRCGWGADRYVSPEISQSMVIVMEGLGAYRIACQLRITRGLAGNLGLSVGKALRIERWRFPRTVYDHCSVKACLHRPPAYTAEIGTRSRFQPRALHLG